MFSQLEEAEASGGCFEPWHPKIGDHVRIRVSPECQAEWDEDSCMVELGFRYGHLSVENGMTAIVDGVNIRAYWHPKTQRTHCYRVRYDKPWDIMGDGKHVFSYCSYAATELELIQDDV